MECRGPGSEGWGTYPVMYDSAVLPWLTCVTQGAVQGVGVAVVSQISEVDRSA